MPQRPRAEAKRFILHIYISMAKAKSGGTRSYLRGRIANDVYSIGKDAKGKKQQVVRSLAESVANPQTLAQMKGRMIMSTVMQAVSAMAVLVDHSFDNVPNGQPSISEFIRRNYALVKADVAAHPAAGNAFELNAYQTKGILPGAYLVSDGQAVLPKAIPVSQMQLLQISVQDTAATRTAKSIRDAFGIADGDFITVVGINQDGGAAFFRVSLNFGVADETAITAANIASLFTIDNPLGLNVTTKLEDNVVTIGEGTTAVASLGYIYSKKVESGFEHSNTVLQNVGNIANPSDTVLPTYPLGTERFLNGGEL